VVEAVCLITPHAWIAQVGWERGKGRGGCGRVVRGQSRIGIFHFPSFGSRKFKFWLKTQSPKNQLVGAKQNNADACGRHARTRYRTTKQTNTAVSQSETAIARVTQSHICVCCCSECIPPTTPFESSSRMAQTDK